MRFVIAGLLILGAGCSRPSEPSNPSPIAAASDPVSVVASSDPVSVVEVTPQVGDRATAGNDDAQPQFTWPSWLGPDGTGISQESNWNAQWPESGLPIVWRGSIGTGFSAVSVADGRLYTMGYRGGQDVVYCFDAETGDKQWERSYACELVDNLHEGGPAATPTIVGDRVFTFSREGHLHCFHAETGEVLWRRELKPELGATQPQWGFTSSPFISGKNVVVDVGFVVAVDQESGEIAWKTANHNAGYGTAAAVRNAGRDLLAVFNNDGLLVVSAADGQQVAFQPFASQFATTSTTPIVAGDEIFVSVGYNGGCALYRLIGEQLDTLYAHRNMSNHFNNCVLIDGHLYGFDGNSHVSSQVRLVCMNWETGDVKWAVRGYGCGSLMAADGKLIVLSDEGTLAVAPASPLGLKEYARAKVLDGRCWTMPVLVNGRIYCRDAGGDLVCVDVRH